MSAFARLSLRNRSLVGLITLVVIGFGLFVVPTLKQQLFPSIQLPAAVVITPYPGASPDTVATQVTEPIESSLQNIAGVENVTSKSGDGSSTVQVQFTYGTDVERAVGQMQQAVNRIRPQLPQNVESTVAAGSTDDFPVAILAAASDGDQQQLAGALRAQVVPELKKIEGVRDVTITGTREQTVQITPDYAKLAAAGIDPAALATALRTAGTPTPAGTVSEGDKSLTVQVGGPLGSVDELRNLYLSSTTPGKGATLGSVATVETALAPATAVTRTNGTPSLGVMVTMTRDGNAVDISTALNAKLADLGTAVGAKLTVIFDQGPEVEKAISGLTTEGLLGLAFAVLVILLFLLSLRSTIVTAVSIPLSVLVALIALWVGDLSLNLLTLGALTIAIGRVVDDSIVVLENIKRHLAYGEAKDRAVLDGVREVAGAVTASTLTTVAVFLPIAFVSGIAGELFAPFSITVSVALVASLLVSLTVVPVLAYWFLKPPKAGEDTEAVRVRAEEKERRSILQRAYIPVIRFATKRRLVTLLVAVLILVGTFGLAGKLESNFIDDSDGTTLSISQQLPPGTSLATRDAASKKIEDVLKNRSEVTAFQVTVGSDDVFAAFGGGSTTASNFSLTVTEGTDLSVLQDSLREQLRTLPDVGDLKFGAEAQGFSSDKLEVIVKAPDARTLATAAGSVQQAVAGTAGLTEVTNDLAQSAPQVRITVNPQAAAAAGLSPDAIGQIAAQAITGTRLGQLPIGGTRYDLVLRTGAQPADVAALKALPLPSAAGVVPLSQVADVATVDGPVQLKRNGGEASATVSAKATGSDLGAVTTDLTKRLDELTLPGGASYEIGGVSKEQAESFGQLGLAMLAAIAIVFMIMVATFRSLIQPLILLVSIPFAATGAIGLLLATGTPLGLPSMIGLLMLVGIVVTNAIVLIDLINQYRKDGMGVQEAVIEGGRRRLRPILMTASATIFALLPMAMGITGQGGFIGQPLALVVIGGLISSTLLTLVLVPTLYTMVENRKEKRRLKREAKRAAKAAPAPEPELQNA